MKGSSAKILAITFSAIFLFQSVTVAQTEQLTLATCYELVEKNYPLIKSRDLISQKGAYSKSNVNSGLLPSIAVHGQYTNQSDVTSLPIELPNISIPEIDQNQYKVYAEVSQVVYDGGVIKNQRQSLEMQTRIEEESLEVELYKVKERVNQLFFGILLIDGQISQADLLMKDILLGLDKTEAAYKNGIVLKSNVDALKAELLKLDQRIIELKSSRKGYMNMLSLFINKPVDSNTVLVVPPLIELSDEVNRPEMGLFESQLNNVSIQSKAITSKNLPKVNLFFQGGYGSPALNMLNPDADTYYIAGVKLYYPLTGFYNKHREKLINTIARKNIEIQRETFLFNTNVQLVQQESEIEKIEQLIKTDDEILSLRESIMEAALAQLQNGVITSMDYMREVNAADSARQMKLIHEIQLLLSQYNYHLITGN